ncbi:MAG: tetratricopeptide repeat protein, partial [Chloroflexota bacterium]
MNNPLINTDTLTAYIPMDRRQAILAEQDLPEQSDGSALFADISGFTPLTEALVNELGPERGAEELTHQLNEVYDALITELHHFGGSVISFSGDAITCWFGNDTGLRGTACALAMQQVMKRFSSLIIPSGKTISLAMKAAVAVGSPRRFLIGNPDIQRIDVLAGSTLDHLAAAEHQAEKGEVVLDPRAISALQEQIEISDWRDDPEMGLRFGVVKALRENPTSNTWPKLPQGKFSSKQEIRTQFKPWLLPPVYERLEANRGNFLAELRPAVALFLRFGGIDYDDDPKAQEKLDQYLRWVQSVLVKYDVYPLQLTVGDKGSYLYTAFGAPIAHEDDSVRAVRAALELQSPPDNLNFIEPVQIGISQGKLRTGAYGGTKRRTYGVLGDEVNLAARLMQAAQPGKTLVSSDVMRTAGDNFDWHELDPMTVKGKAMPITTYEVSGIKTRQSHRLQTQNYVLPIVGREDELATVKEKLQLALGGQGQVIGVTGGAGSGKSRLIAGLVDLSDENDIEGYDGECQSYGTNTSYMVWQSIWRGIFALNTSLDTVQQIEHLESYLRAISPDLVQRTPLLSTLLDIPIPDNELTSTFDAKLRKTSLESLLVDCIRAKASQAPVMIVLEDTQWLDPMSIDLLEVVGQTIIDLPVLIIVAYRPAELMALQPPWSFGMAHFSEVSLNDLNRKDAEALVDLKLKQLFDPNIEIAPPLLDLILNRAEGNPFYIESLMNYLQDQQIDPTDKMAATRLRLPSSLHSIVLSRIDQLTEHQKTTLKVASVIGRLFKTGYLWATYPELGDPDDVYADLSALTDLNLTQPDATESELTYIFKHILTQEVSYQSLPYATRATLHEQLAWTLEHRADLDAHRQNIDLLAYHYGLSQNTEKQREYFLKAGELAQAEYANETATDYYQRLIQLLPRDEKANILKKLGDVQQLVGNWDAATTSYEEAIEIAKDLADVQTVAWCQASIGDIQRKQGNASQALTWLEKARIGFTEIGEQAGKAQVLHTEGTLAAMQGDFDTANLHYNDGLTIRRELQDTQGVAALLLNLGIVAHRTGEYDQALALYQESLELGQSLNDRWHVSVSLINLGYVALDQQHYDQAKSWLEEAVSLLRMIGDRAMTSNALNNLANVLREQRDFPEARRLYEESLTIGWSLGDKVATAYLLEDIGCLNALQSDPEAALILASAADKLRQEIDVPLPAPEKAKLDQTLEAARTV